MEEFYLSKMFYGQLKFVAGHFMGTVEKYLKFVVILLFIQLIENTQR